MQAAFQRTLRPGTEYSRYFDLSGLERSDPVVLADGDTFDTIQLMAKLARQYQGDTARLAPVLKGATLEATCRNNWNFAYHHFQYTPDNPQVEQLRRPLRAWADRKAGIDCDCYSILLSTLLLNQGIPHRLRKTKYGGGADYQHIYVVVPVPGTRRTLTLDPVTDRFDHEVPFTAHYDLDMPVQVLNGLPLQVLNGLTDAPGPALVPAGAYGAFGFGAEFVGIAAEGEAARQMALRGEALRGEALNGPAEAAVADADVSEIARLTGQTPEEARADAEAVRYLAASFTERIRQHLLNQVELIRHFKEARLYPLVTRYEAILQVWDDAPERDRRLAHYAAQEQQAGGLSGLGDWWDSVTNGISSAWNAVTGAVSSAASWVSNGVSSAWAGIQQAAGWVSNQVSNAATATWNGIKQAARWVGNQAVELGKLIVKYSPLSVLVRAGLRVAFRVNLFYMSSRLGNGYYSEAEARAAGLNIAEWNNCKSTLGKVISMWDGLQGDQGILRESILLGYSSSDHFHIASAPSGLNGLGDLTTATTTSAAAAFIAKIINWLKDVDWGKLIDRVASVAQKLAQRTAQASVPATINENTPLPSSEQDYTANKQHYDSGGDRSAGGSTLPLLAGVGLLGLYLASATSPKQ